MPYIRSVYRALAADENIANFHLAEEGHDYGPGKRGPMYRFMAKHLKLDLAAVTNLDGSIDESDIPIEPREALCVFNEDHPRPERALLDRDALRAVFQE